MRLAAVGVVLAATLAVLAVGAVGPLAGRREARPAAAAAMAGGQGAPVGEPRDDGLPIPEPGTDESNRRADEIVAGPRFQEPPKSLIDRILDWIAEQLDKIQVPGVGGGAAGGSQIVVWVFIALLVGLAIFLVARMRVSRRPSRDDPDFIVDAEVARPAHEWLSEAERFEAEGAWKQALRCRFRALVSALIDRGVVRDIPGRTTGEYRVEVRRNAERVAPAFAGAADLFERARYGDEDTGPDENARFRSLADDVVAGLSPEPAVGATAGAGTP